MISMSQLIKRFLWVVLLASGLQASWAYSLLGPVGTGDDSWQVTLIGYNPLAIQAAPPFIIDGLSSGPKNLGEEYRRNTPFLYYTCDANFLDYFGSNGVAAVDQAFGILNNAFTNNPTGMTNGVDGYSSDLSEFSLDTMTANYTAQALNLDDLKSATLALMAEQLGLADSVRYTWALHDRYQPTGTTCPLDTEYTVIMRNFDFTASPLNQLQPSPYVNAMLYSYYIYENCGATLVSPPNADAIEVAVDPLANNPPVASEVDNLVLGSFYTGLTRDDMAGLRYLLSSNNINIEPGDANSVQLLTNTAPNLLITNLPLGELLSAEQFLSPAQLQALFPGLSIATTTNFLQVVVGTNVSFYYTNTPAITNLETEQLFTNLDLGLFLLQAQTDSPSVLEALYPTLDILSSNYYYTNVGTPNVISYFAPPGVGSPAGTLPTFVVKTNFYNTNYLQIWNYTYGNIVTNFYSPSNTVTIQSITFTNPIGAPAGTSVQATNDTNVKIKSPSGDFYIIPTNWCGYTIVATLNVQRTLSTSNVISTAVTNSGTTAIQGTESIITFYTNRVLAIEPGICSPSLVVSTNVTTNAVTVYQTTFANIVTNFYSNSIVSILTTNIGPCTPGFLTPICTNVTFTTILTNLPTGQFYIIPTNFCGFSIVSTIQSSLIAVTNTIFVITNGDQLLSESLVTYLTNSILLVQPDVCSTASGAAISRRGIQKIQFTRANFDSLLGQFFQPVTNTYTMMVVSNSQPVTQYFQRVITQPDILFSAADFAPGPAVGPATFPVPSDRNVSFSPDSASAYPGLAGPGLISTPSTITYNKVGPLFGNSGPNFLSGPNTNAESFVWGSFDGSTNDPVVYPDGTSIQNLENEVLVQISPTSLSDGTNNVAYPATTFTATGGSFNQPFTWSAPDGLPPGLSIVSNSDSTGTFLGTPTQSGLFGPFVIQLTDSLGRSAQWSYSITIH